MRNKIYIIVSIVLFLFCMFFFYKWKTSPSIENIDGTVMVNKIEKVMKMVSVEANFSELLTYQDYEYIDFPGFRKKAIIKVDAKVLAGIDMNKLKIEIKEKEKIILIKNMPEAEILAIDHNLSYYDMQNGIFNSFDEKTLSDLQGKAKQLILEKAKETDILKQANEQRFEHLELIYYLAKSTGWKVLIEGKELNNIKINK
jgi:preprotein translocase subunit SecF